jgi:hypothetical protein
VPALYTYDYAIIRLVPRVEREEFVNVGVIVSCPACGFLEARIALDEQRLLALDATLDMATVRDHLATILLMCAGGASAGPLGQLAQRERFHWLVAARSTIIQTSPVHTGLCTHPGSVLAHLLDTMVRPARPASPTATGELVETARTPPLQPHAATRPSGRAAAAPDAERSP